MNKEKIIHSITSLKKYLYNKTDVKDILKYPTNKGDLRPFFEDHPMDSFYDKLMEAFFYNLDQLKRLFDSNLVLKSVKEKLENTVNVIIENKNILVNLSIEEFCDIARCNAVLNIYLCSSFAELTTNDFKELKQTLNKLYLLFREQTNYKYGILPSMYRELVLDNKTIDVETIKEKYNEFGLIKKYNKVTNNSVKNINYDMISYIQHSLSYSPLLDLTDSLDVAIVFATSSLGIGLNAYQKTDAAVFAFIFEDENSDEKHNEISKLNVEWINNKVTFDKVMNKKYLFLNKSSDFNITYYIEKNPTNDRMKCQRGSFFELLHGYIVNGHMLIPSSQITVLKFRIDAKEKMKMYNNVIKNHPEFSIGNLLNPYNYINTL